MARAICDAARLCSMPALMPCFVQKTVYHMYLLCGVMYFRFGHLCQVSLTRQPQYLYKSLLALIAVVPVFISARRLLRLLLQRIIDALVASPASPKSP